jgi:predicted nucleic acid-binding protein
VFLDTAPLSLATQRKGRSPEADDCRAWTLRLQDAGVLRLVPKIADYELRRELLRNENVQAVARLESFATDTSDRYVPIDTATWREAARLWANVRRRGVPTASDAGLDGDALLAAQVFLWSVRTGVPLVRIAVATSNVGHLNRFIDANDSVLPAFRWQDIAA